MIADCRSIPFALASAGVSQAGRPALLWSGGIGDFLHYVSRLTSFMQEKGLAPADFDVVVEATSPVNVGEMLRACVPEVHIEFAPPAIHWTKAHPLLEIDNEQDRRERPAFRGPEKPLDGAYRKAEDSWSSRCRTNVIPNRITCEFGFTADLGP